MSNPMRDLTAHELDSIIGGYKPAPPSTQPHFKTPVPYNDFTLRLESAWLDVMNICMCGCGAGVCNMGTGPQT